MIIHYNCTIGSILLHSFLLICHPYPSSFHEMIFTLVYILPSPPPPSLLYRVCILIMCVHFSSDYNPVLPIGTDALTEEANRIAAELGTPVSDFLASDEFTSVDPETLELDPDEVAILQALLEVTRSECKRGVSA